MFLLGELDIIEDNQRPIDFDDCSVVNSGSDVVVPDRRCLVDFVDIDATSTVVTSSVVSHLF